SDLRRARDLGRWARSPAPARVRALPGAARGDAGARGSCVTVRVATDADFPAILDVHARAFTHDPTVPGIVEGLHELGLHVPSLSFVAVEGERVVGHVMSSWSEVEGSDERYLQLSPLGVLPESQRRGHGSALVRATLDGARALGEPVIFLEGNPAYYGRFGFVRAD